MARSTAQVQAKIEVVATRAQERPVPPLALPPHLKPLTGPTGPKPSY